MKHMLLTRLVIEGQPLAKKRPRVTQHGTYTPSAKDEEALAWKIKAQRPGRHTEAVSVSLRFVRSDRRKVDIDNLIKLILDACTKAGVWDDDSQVTKLEAEITYDKAMPLTEIVVVDR